MFALKISLFTRWFMGRWVVVIIQNLFHFSRCANSNYYMRAYFCVFQKKKHLHFKNRHREKKVLQMQSEQFFSFFFFCIQNIEFQRETWIKIIAALKREFVLNRIYMYMYCTHEYMMGWANSDALYTESSSPLPIVCCFFFFS